LPILRKGAPLSVIPDHYAVDNLHGLVTDLVNCDDVESLNARAGDDRYRQAVSDASRTLASQAFTDHDEDAARRANATPAVLYDWSFSRPSSDGSDPLLQVVANDSGGVFETAMLEDIYGRMDLSSLSGVPEDHESFLPWYRHFISIHQASNHSFYRDFLENR